MYNDVATNGAESVEYSECHGSRIIFRETRTSLATTTLTHAQKI
jgi:hypothetical protein